MKTPPRFPLTLPFDHISAADLPLVGGKGANLGEMARAGFPVPPGFCLTTAAFRRFIAACLDADDLYAALDAVSPHDVAAARRVGQQVRHTLQDVPVPDEVATAVLTAWRDLGSEHAVAVRSSATAEDLPDASFAGQQDTILNVRGAAALLDAVRTCWISLFTDRAILYRARSGFDHRQVALSVVVQQMVQPEVSGILFTADPVSGHRSIASIDAGYGLGEALVAGLVDADLYKVDKRTQQVVDVQVGDKQMAIRPLPHGGTERETITGAARTARALSDAQAVEVAAIGARIEHHYGRPQDVEWALADGTFYVVQSRPITALFPVPPRGAVAPMLHVYFSFAAVQGVMDPITPLGRDVMREFFAGAARLFGYRVTAQTQTVVHEAAQRLWIDFTALVRHPIGRPLLRSALGAIEPSAAQALTSVWHEPDLQPQQGWFRLRTARRIWRVLRPVVGRFLRTLRRPAQMRADLLQSVAAFVHHCEDELQQATTLAQRLDWFERLMVSGFSVVLPVLLPLIAGGLSSLNGVLRLARTLPDDAPNPMMLTRGLPNNVTTEMDLALWQTAAAIRADSAAMARFTQGDPAALAQAYLHNELPPAAQTAVADFMARYGMRGVGEIDLGRPRWRENPAPIMQSLQSYLRITDPAHAPDAVFRRSAAEAEQAIDRLAAAARKTRFGRLKARLIRTLARRVRLLAGAREMPKFTIIRLMGMARAALLESGAELVQQGVLHRADDLFFLRLAELKALDGGEQRDWQGVVAERRQAMAKEKRRRQIPRLLLSDGRAFYQGMRRETAVADDGALVGSPVSPGVVEGVVHVVFDPHESQLAPGEILVCPGTDPAWTPLFLAAGGLVMEVGGLMTHGSVVAREYGIPAVVGVHEATQRLKTGQHIRVDGTAGTVTVIREP